ncbi:MAG: hypothetical protein V4660_15630 [Pseudomonadota bacterium]
MHKNTIFNVLLSCLLFLAVLLTSCSKKNEPKEHMQTYDEMVAERKRDESVPPIDPSICKDNPEGYIYFQFGEEVFRYTKDSPIKVGLISINSEWRLKRKIKDTTIPEGCEGNPYTHIGLKVDFSEAEKIIGKFTSDGFGLKEVSPDKYNIISPAQSYKEEYFYFLKDKHNSCEEVTDNLTRCGFKNDDPKVDPENRDGQYMANNDVYTTAVDRPYVLDCHGYVGYLQCEAQYRLYPSVDIGYKFIPEALNKKNILVFDQYFRQLFENMRVTRKSEPQSP